MKTIIEFINDLSSNDIDLVDKLDNLHGHGQISDTVYKLCQDEETFDIIEHYVREILQDDIGDTELAKEYINFIIEETENLYEQELINEPDDFASGLYNCDDLFLYAIADALDIYMNDLETYTEEEK